MEELKNNTLKYKRAIRGSNKGKIVNYVCEFCQKDFSISKTHSDRLNRANKERRFCSMFCVYQNTKRETRSKIDINKVIDLYKNQGLSAINIAKIVNSNHFTIYRILKENNIKVRENTCRNIRKMSEETKDKIRKKAIQRYIDHPEKREQIRQRMLQQIKNGKLSKIKSNTSIEIKIKDLLIELGIPFEQQKIFNRWCFDFFLPTHGTFIECDGDYWHGNPNKYTIEKLDKIQEGVIERDKRKEAYLHKRHYRLLRFWQEDIDNNIDMIKNRILATTYDSYKDSLRIELLESKLFQFITFDEITKQWCIKDEETGICYSYGDTLRQCVDKLIGNIEKGIVKI